MKLVFTFVLLAAIGVSQAKPSKVDEVKKEFKGLCKKFHHSDDPLRCLVEIGASQKTASRPDVIKKNRDVYNLCMKHQLGDDFPKCLNLIGHAIVDGRIPSPAADDEKSKKAVEIQLFMLCKTVNYRSSNLGDCMKGLQKYMANHLRNKNSI